MQNNSEIVVQENSVNCKVPHKDLEREGYMEESLEESLLGYWWVYMTSLFTMLARQQIFSDSWGQIKQ